ncbi:MAG: HSP90 family protein [Bifidobacteriaceae bacterium]|jgi:molecular chaperone HtpG|nr:HSP90 family protein [Bifidobacteriaceae bacterium]
MPSSPRAAPFRVELRGVVDLLSRHIYSGPRVYLRELLQNATDAITARRELAPDDPGANTWGIRIAAMTSATGEFCLTDDGIGLTREEATELLSTVGATSKRDILDFPRSDYLGQFGIGLLSCFMVADCVRVVSRSAKGGAPIEWQGNANGTFTVVEVSDDVPIGTSVRLQPRFDGTDLLGPAAVADLAKQFGQYLPVPLRVVRGAVGEAINRRAVFADRTASSSQIAEFGREFLGAEPLDAIPLACPATGTRGLGFVLPFSPPPSAHQASAVYLGRMLVGHRLDGILPEWAFFVRACIDSTGLTPTASREAIVEDVALEVTRQAFGQAIRNWLAAVAQYNPHRLERLLAVHESAIKQMVLHDAELAAIMAGHLTLETSQGRRRIAQLVEEHPVLRYTETVDEYRQVVAVASSGPPIVNGGYLWDAELTRSLSDLYGTAVEQIDPLAELDMLDPPPLADRAVAIDLERRATAALAGRDCQVVVRAMGDGQLPTVFVADQTLFHRLDRARSEEEAGPLWRGVLDRAGAAIVRKSGRQEGQALSRLCLNWLNPLVVMLARLSDETVFSRCVQLLYVQAQLASHRPIAPSDRALLDSALGDLVALSVDIDHGVPPETE